jgi:hypothetical protein
MLSYSDFRLGGKISADEASLRGKTVQLTQEEIALVGVSAFWRQMARKS